MHGVVLAAVRHWEGRYQTCNPWLELSAGVSVPVAVCNLLRRTAPRSASRLFGGLPSLWRPRGLLTAGVRICDNSENNVNLIMQKHAYCIMAHNEPALLRSLLAQLDDERNDIFLHLDAKADARLFDQLSCRHARIFRTPQLRVFWCDFSTTEAELLLFRFARSHGHYAYYHLLSGADQAIKSQDDIHAYCEAHAGEEFVEFSTDARNLQQAIERTCRWYFFVKLHRHPNGKVRRLFTALDNLLLSLQRAFHIRRNRGLVPGKGSNWVSVTEGFVDWLLPHEDEIRRTYRHTFCAEETFLQTLFLRSPFAKNVSPSGNMREIDWERGDPYVWKSEDADRLTESPCFFARKFSSAHFGIVDNINARLKTAVPGLT